VVNNPKPIGGINATDAAQANYWFATSSYSVQHARFLAGDVSYDWFINSTQDAIDIQKYFVYGTQFTRKVVTGTPWAYWKVVSGSELILSNSNPYTIVPFTWPTSMDVTISGSNVTYNMYTVVIGDFNTSFSPAPGKGAASETLLLTYDETYKVEAGTEVELPVRVVNTSDLGAASLILNFPDDLMQVTEVTMKANDGRLDWAAHGNELRIGWNTLNPVIFEAGENLVVIKLRTSSSFTEGENIRITLAPRSRAAVIFPAQSLAASRMRRLHGAGGWSGSTRIWSIRLKL